MRNAKQKSENQSIAVVEAGEFFKASSKHGDATVLVGSDLLHLSHLHKIFWPKEGYTKFDLLKYYFMISDTILPYLKDRPLILKRYPNGIAGQMFYQHNLEEAPKYVKIFETHESNGKVVHNPLANNLAALLYLVNLGTIAQNPWFSRVQSIGKPDYIAFDLDPGDQANFEQVKDMALEIKVVLDQAGLTGYPKTSGSRGIHIYVPIKTEYTYEKVFPFAKALASIVANRNPNLATIRRIIHDRKPTQVYIDYLQNFEGKSLAAPYSVRERPHALVSAPMEWEEITKKLTLEEFNINTIQQRILRNGDLFYGVLENRQSLDDLMKAAVKIN